MFATRLLAVALLRSARPTLQNTYQHHFPRYQRSFSASSTSRSSPTPDSLTEFNAELQKTSIWKKLAGHPDAIAAIQDFGRILQKSGIDPTAGKPSTFTLMKLAASSEFRASIARVKEEMGKAGVDLTSPDILQEVMNLQKTLGPKA